MKAFILLITLLMSSSIYAQSLDDVGKIVIGVDVPETSSTETKELKEYIVNKISHWVAQAGYSAKGFSSFSISPNIIIDSEDVAEGGMKNVYVIKGSLFLSVLQNDGDVVFSSISLPFRDSSTKKITAIKNGIGKLQYKKMIPLLDEAKERILKYYESQKANIFAQADFMAKQKDYDGAIAYIMSIPSSLTNIYQEALTKADSYLEKKNKAYNDSVFVVANSYLAQHDARAALDVLTEYKDMQNGQDQTYKQILSKAEALVTAEELAAARERRRQYLDEKERQYHQWEVEEKERNHRMSMDNQHMAYRRAALASNERTEARKIAAGERLASQVISANERISHHRIYAIKSVASEYYKNNQTRTLIVKHQY